MLFMVMERFKQGPSIVGARFREKGRMMPEGVIYHTSWVEPDGSRCFQLTEAPDRDSLDSWIGAWSDIVDFEVIPVLSSVEFWTREEMR